MSTLGQAAQDRGNRRHLWIVVSRPTAEGMIAVVNLESHRARAGGHDESCVLLQPGEHPFVRRTTCVNYRRAKMESEAVFDSKARVGRRVAWDPLGPELLRRIQEGALTTPQKIPKRVVAAISAALLR